MSRTEPTFAEFYQEYLAHHRHPLNRALHLLAKLLAVASLAGALYERSLLLLLAAPVLAVAPCWLGHLWFEGNRPVSWEQPSASLLGTLAGRLRSLAGRPPAGAGTSPSGGRAYYSFVADLRMCGETLVSRGTKERT
ncbi:MAG TPA: Mpo1-like protein [Thermoanaerobaculia bacterium]|nr:Mpo1-like protein [Thermoanaerobaculia bacterium]